VPSPDLDALLADQIAYYRALAREYEEHSLTGAQVEDAAREAEAALEAFAPAGDVLELACGTGYWTGRLLAHADSVTALDASPEMLAIARDRIGDDAPVRFVQADVFAWKADRRYDVVFFAFWLSHVPLERFEAFWSLVGDCLGPGGRVFFVDDAYRTQDELIEGESGSTIRRRLKDGSEHRAVKVPHTARELEARLAALGWRISVTQTSGPFYWGSGGLHCPGSTPPRLQVR
jgi:SAM-dependent methyltransferase